MRLFPFCFYVAAIGTIPILLNGCGTGSNAAIPGSASARTTYDLDGGAYRTIYTFRDYHGGPYGPNGQFVSIGGVLYGTTSFGGHGGLGNGTFFSLTQSGGERDLYKFKNESSGHNPNGGLVAVDGVLYGTTSGGGGGCPLESGCGTVFAITPSGKEQTIYRFKGGTDGITPSGSLASVDGELYGATSLGGTTSPCPNAGSFGTGCGTVFSVDTSGNERVLYRFRGNRDGAYPNAPLLALNGKLYGTTGAGGAGGSCHYDCGTLFEITTSGEERVLHRFRGGGDGSGPGPGLIAVGGVLYGTTGNDGASDWACCGTVFKATTSGSESVIYSFKGPPDAGSPNGMLVMDRGLLYGTASGGESCGYSDGGTIFDVSTAGVEHVAYTFSCKSVIEPSPGLLRLDRTLYGSASDAIFAFTP
ncbi:MAG: choice-of-anchor tandem repeat GloVer-containing protein [Candidatus Cybelea sp.]